MNYQDEKVNEVEYDLKTELERINSDIKKYGIFKVLVSQLVNRKDDIQRKLDEIANKKGILTNEELYDAQILAATAKAKALKNENKRTIINGLLYVGGFGVLIFGIWYFTIKKRN